MAAMAEPALEIFLSCDLYNTCFQQKANSNLGFGLSDFNEPGFITRLYLIFYFNTIFEEPVWKFIPQTHLHFHHATL